MNQNLTNYQTGNQKFKPTGQILEYNKGRTANQVRRDIEEELKLLEDRKRALVELTPTGQFLKHSIYYKLIGLGNGAKVMNGIYNYEVEHKLKDLPLPEREELIRNLISNGEDVINIVEKLPYYHEKGFPDSYYESYQQLNDLEEKKIAEIHELVKEFYKSLSVKMTKEHHDNLKFIRNNQGMDFIKSLAKYGCIFFSESEVVGVELTYIVARMHIYDLKPKYKRIMAEFISSGKDESFFDDNSAESQLRNKIIRQYFEYLRIELHCNMFYILMGFGNKQTGMLRERLLRAKSNFADKTFNQLNELIEEKNFTKYRDLLLDKFSLKFAADSDFTAFGYPVFAADGHTQLSELKPPEELTKKVFKELRNANPLIQYMDIVIENYIRSHSFKISDYLGVQIRESVSLPIETMLQKIQKNYSIDRDGIMAYFKNGLDETIGKTQTELKKYDNDMDWDSLIKNEDDMDEPINNKNKGGQRENVDVFRTEYEEVVQIYHKATGTTKDGKYQDGVYKNKILGAKVTCPHLPYPNIILDSLGNYPIDPKYIQTSFHEFKSSQEYFHYNSMVQHYSRRITRFQSLSLPEKKKSIRDHDAIQSMFSFYISVMTKMKVDSMFGSANFKQIFHTKKYNKEINKYEYATENGVYAPLPAGYTPMLKTGMMSTNNLRVYASPTFFDATLMSWKKNVRNSSYMRLFTEQKPNLWTQLTQSYQNTLTIDQMVELKVNLECERINNWEDMHISNQEKEKRKSYKISKIQIYNQLMSPTLRIISSEEAPLDVVAGVTYALYFDTSIPSKNREGETILAAQLDSAYTYYLTKWEFEKILLHKLTIEAGVSKTRYNLLETLIHEIEMYSKELKNSKPRTESLYVKMYVTKDLWPMIENGNSLAENFTLYELSILARYVIKKIQQRIKYKKNPFSIENRISKNQIQQSSIQQQYTKIARNVAKEEALKVAFKNAISEGDKQHQANTISKMVAPNKEEELRRANELSKQKRALFQNPLDSRLSGIPNSLVVNPYARFEIGIKKRGEDGEGNDYDGRGDGGGGGNGVLEQIRMIQNQMEDESEESQKAASA